MEKVKEKLKELNPEQVLENFLKWFDSKKRMAFLITLLVGIIAHITMLTETIMSQDGLWGSIAYSRPGTWEKSLGRWGIELIQRFNSFVAIPTVSTISSIICMAIASVFLVDIFELKNKISIIFTSLILVLTPTFTATLLYVYTAFAYCANFFISTLVIWLLYKFKYKKIGFIFAVLCFALSLSIYQSYIGVSIGLCVMVNVLDIIKNKKTMKEIFINIGLAILVTIIGAIFYFLLTQIILSKYNLELANYKGFESNLNAITILKNFGTSIINTYKDFLMFFLGNDIVYNTNYRREVFYGIFLSVLGIASILSIIYMDEIDKKWKIKKGILAGIFIFVIPIALNIIDIIVVENDMYSLTSSQMILIIPFGLAIFECLDRSIILKWIAVICCIYIMGTYYIANNASYAALKLTYNQAYSTTVRIMDRVENTEGYQKEFPILFGGIVGNDNYPRTSNLYGYTIGSIVNNTAFHGTYNGATGTWVKFIKIFFGLDVQLCTPDVYYRIVTGEEYKQMEIFPAQDSIRIINGVVVIKLSDTPPLPY